MNIKLSDSVILELVIYLLYILSYRETKNEVKLYFLYALLLNVFNKKNKKKNK